MTGVVRQPGGTNCGTSAPTRQSLPIAHVLGSLDLATGYLRCLHAIGQACARGLSASELAAAAAARIVEHCADIHAALVYGVDGGGERAFLLAMAGDPCSAPEPSVERMSDAWPPPFEDAARRCGTRRRIVATLGAAAGALPLGWLVLECEGAETPACGLFADGAAQALAAAMTGLAARAKVRLHAQETVRRDRQLIAHNRDLEAQVAVRTADLSASEARFKAISNLVPDILWRADAQGRVEWRSAQWARFTGDDGTSPDMAFVHPDDRARTRAWVRETIAGRVRAAHECRLLRHDGVYHWFVARMSALADAQGVAERWFGSATDIERQQLARHALEVQVDQGTAALERATRLQQELLHQLSRSQEDERRRIARELHDSLGQYLTALKLALSALVPAVIDPQARALVVRLDALTTEVDRELDDIIAALRPVVLDELGLAGALPGIVADWSRQSGIAAEVLLVQVGAGRFDDESESTLYRVTQESLTNVVKHARARNVAVTLAWRQGELQLSVEDDGRGFDPSRSDAGWGLRGMAERARGVGGLLQVESTPGGGTTILVRIPCGRPSPGLPNEPPAG